MQYRNLVWLIFVAIACSSTAHAVTPAPGKTDAALRTRVVKVLADTPLIDGHNDLPWELRTRGDVDLLVAHAAHGQPADGKTPAASARRDADRAAEVARFVAPPGGLYIGQPERVKAALTDWDKHHPTPVVTVGMVAGHIQHIRKVAGIGSVGLGSDFDGIRRTPKGLDAVDKYPALADQACASWLDRRAACCRCR